jgi:hypothetical protein
VDTQDERTDQLAALVEAALPAGEPTGPEPPPNDAEALAAVARITGGNFRLVQRLFAQIQCIMEINNLSTVTREVVETARESLVTGSL